MWRGGEGPVEVWGHRRRKFANLFFLYEGLRISPLSAKLRQDEGKNK